MTISSNATDILLRLEARIKATKPDSEVLAKAFTRVGILIASQTQINIRQKGLIDTGRLLNSVKYELFKEGEISGVRVGSFGVPYASVQEYGFNGTVRAHKRLIRKVFGKTLKEPKTIDVRAYQLRIRGKYFLGEAVQKQSSLVLDILREALTSD
jgi:hypothetical protein